MLCRRPPIIGLMTDGKKPIPPKKGQSKKPVPKKKKPPPSFVAGKGTESKRQPRDLSNLRKPTQYDWDAIRKEYYTGDDTVTLAALAARPGMPAETTLEHRSSAEGWTGLRAEFRREVEQETIRLQAKLTAQTRLDAVSKVRKRHADSGKALMLTASMELNELRKKPGTLKPVDVARFMAVGADLERKAHNMEEVTVNLNDIETPEDLKRLSTAALLELRRRRRAAFGADGIENESGGVPPGPAPGLSMGGSGEGERDDEMEDFE